MEHLSVFNLRLPPAIEKAVLELIQVATYGAWAWTAAGACIAIYYLFKWRNQT